MRPFITNQLKLNELIGNGNKFIIPQFQRDYSWTEEQWSDLWDDLEAINFAEKHDSHYMGYLVLQQMNDTDYIVIDGQQRLTTLMIIFIAACYIFQDMIDNNRDIADNEFNKESLKRYIGPMNEITRKIENKITLNRNNEYFFNRYLCQFSIDYPKSKLTQSENLLNQAKDFFIKKLENKFETGNQITEFILQNIIHRLYFTTIIVDDETNTFNIFETLNARGVQLSTTDLLKNYLMSCIANENNDDRYLNELDEDWKHITDILGQHSFSDFIRYEWNSRNHSVTNSQLFKKIKDTIKTAQSCFDYTKILRNQSYIFTALHKPEHEIWSNEQFNENQRETIKSSLEMLNLFRIQQPIPLLLSAKQKLNSDDFTKLLKYIEVISIRYNIICQKPTNEQDKFYKTLALDMSLGKIDIKEIKLRLKKLYPSDQEFLTSFIEKEFKDANSRPKLILLRLNHAMCSSLGKLHTNLTVEHILPKNPDTTLWHSKFTDIESSIYKIANLVLIPKKANKNIDRCTFEEKKKKILESNLAINSMLVEFDDWNDDTLQERQEELAKQATMLWRIDF